MSLSATERPRRAATGSALEVNPMHSLIPGTGLVSFRKEVDRLFDRFWDRDFEYPTNGEWMPPLDLTETKDALICKLDVPGMEPKDIRIIVQDNVLTVRGEKKVEKVERDETYHRSERQYGAFARTMRIPAPVDGSKISATFRNGVLTIVMPKAPEAKGTEVPIKIA
jgi:HSP20 family protein